MVESHQRLLMVFVAFFVAAGCATDRERRDRYLRANPDLDPNVREAVGRGNVLIGMSASDVLASMGKPTKEVGAADEAHGPMKVWIYDYSYVDDFGFLHDSHGRHHLHAGRLPVVIGGMKVWLKGNKVVRFEEY